MLPRTALLDSAVPILANGTEYELRAACVRLLDLGSSGRIELFASTEMIQEFVFHRLRRTGDRHRAVAEGEALMGFVVTLPFDDSILRRSFGLMRSTGVRGRDAIHAATALAHGLEYIISPDDDFDGLPGLERLDPRSCVGH
ncbi:MAG: type II toxin-antitoxin system VapC family toxin [Bifidobacteriaceae bacterium]|jgi:predicted nucleic acid-binding protein|nr:type II toxin-antitoxin system VapC family toxin [Bifidobacteriaceae bacterium]